MAAMSTPRGTETVVVVGAGIIGAACAEALSARGIPVTVLDRGGLAAGTTSRCEGNVLVSDKPPGPELDLVRASRAEWPALLTRIGASDDVEWEDKGGLVVATDDDTAAALAQFVAAQRGVGVSAQSIDTHEVRGLEPHITPDVCYAVYYPQDAQVQPVLATTAMLRAVRQRGGLVRSGVTVLGIRRHRQDGAIRAVITDRGDIECAAIVNAAGPWAGQLGDRLGAPVPVQPRQGLILVTAPLPPTVRHKVYDADYVGAVLSGEAALQTSTVVESTAAGPILIGSSRQRVGFSDRIDPAILREIAGKAIRLFPALRSVPLMRAYGGLRPYLPDHLPVIGPDPRAPGVWHATGHEGAGIGLAPATGRLVAELFTGTPPHLDPAPFRVDRPAIGRVA
jgi:glycine/D-amino acid oxidase-like deaminating enzyme